MRGEPGFVVYCKCKPKTNGKPGFTPYPPHVLHQRPYLRGKCFNCGSLKPELRCKIHGLLCLEAQEPGAKRSSAGCPRCGRSPSKQRLDAYMTPREKALYRNVS